MSGIARMLLVLSLGLILAGCEQPERTRDAAFQIRQPVLRQWQEPNRTIPAAGELTLEKVIDEALAASPELAQMEARTAAVREMVKQAEARFYPRLVFNESFNSTDNPVYAFMYILNQRRLNLNTDFNHPQTTQDFQTQLQAQWSLFEGGSRWHNRQAGLRQVEAHAAQQQQGRNDLMAQTVRTWYGWLQAISFIKVAERAVESAQTNLKLAQVRYDAQVALHSEVLRLQTQAVEARSNLVNSKSSAGKMQAAMERLIARRIEMGEIPKGEKQEDGLDEWLIVSEPNQLVEQALRQRPEIAAAAALVQAANERVASAKGGYWPQVLAVGSVQWDSENLSQQERSWLAGIAATWPLFEGGVTRAKVGEAQANLREMRLRGHQLALDIALEVQQANFAVQEAAEQITLARQQRQLAQQSLEEVRQQYQGQTVTVESLLQAELAWRRAEVAWSTALYQGHIAQAALQKSLGEFAGRNTKNMDAEGR